MNQLSPHNRLSGLRSARYLVTGAAGFIGRSIVAALLDGRLVPYGKLRDLEVRSLRTVPLRKVLC